MMENFPCLLKDIDIQPQEAQRVPRTRNLKGSTPRHIIIKMPKVKYKERILKAVKRKVVSDLQQSSQFLKRNYAGQKGLAQNLRCDENSRSPTKNTLSSKAII